MVSANTGPYANSTNWAFALKKNKINKQKKDSLFIKCTLIYYDKINHPFLRNCFENECNIDIPIAIVKNSGMYIVNCCPTAKDTYLLNQLLSYFRIFTNVSQSPIQKSKKE